MRSWWTSAPPKPLIVVCDRRYASVLAVAALVDLGHGLVADVLGGFQAGGRRASRRRAARLTIRTGTLDTPGLTFVKYLVR